MHRDLVGRHLHEVEEGRGDEDGAEIDAVGEGEGKIQIHPSIGEGGFPDATESAGDLVHGDKGDGELPAEKDDELDHIRPDHRAHSAQGGVERGEHAGGQNRHPEGDAGDFFKGERRSVGRGGEPEADTEDEETGGEEADGKAEALFEELVGGVEARLVELGQQPDRCDRGGDEEGEHGVTETEAVLVNIRGSRKVADAREERREDGHGHEEAVHPPPGEEIIAEVSRLAPRRPKPDPDRCGEIKPEEGVVEQGEMRHGTQEWQEGHSITLGLSRQQA